MTRADRSAGENGLRTYASRAGLEPAPHVRLLRLRSEQQELHRSQLEVCADLPDDLDPVGRGHADVEHGDHGPPLAGERERLVPGARRDDVEAVALQPCRDEEEDVLVVLGDEHDGKAHATSSGSAVDDATRCGSSSRKTLPPPARRAAEIRPPCASTTARAMNSPRPVPGTCALTAPGER